MSHTHNVGTICESQDQKHILQTRHIKIVGHNVPLFKKNVGSNVWKAYQMAKDPPELYHWLGWALQSGGIPNRLESSAHIINVETAFSRKQPNYTHLQLISHRTTTPYKNRATASACSMSWSIHYHVTAASLLSSHRQPCLPIVNIKGEASLLFLMSQSLS